MQNFNTLRNRNDALFNDHFVVLAHAPLRPRIFQKHPSTFCPDNYCKQILKSGKRETSNKCTKITEDNTISD